MRVAVQGPVLPGVQPIALAMDPSAPGQVYCATYNRRLWRREDAGETWLPVGTPQRFFEGPAGGAIEPRETTFVSVDPVPQTDGRHAVWVSDCRWSIDVGESARGSATIHRIQAGGVNVFYREAGPFRDIRRSLRSREFSQSLPNFLSTNRLPLLAS
jgi:hypothetical protein